MTALGKKVRLNRIFSHPSGRILAVAVDHLINYPTDLPAGLRPIGETLRQVVEGRPNSVTMNKGIALRYMEEHAGKVPFIVQQMALRPGEDTFAINAEVEEVVAMGADAIAVAMFLGDDREMEFIEHLADVVREAEQYGLPVVPHIYPVHGGDEKHTVAHDAEHIFYCVRMGLELGADIIKVPYTGDVASFRDIVSVTPVPVVTAGGPKCETLADAVALVRDVVKSGAAGATIGRNVWGFKPVPEAVRQLKEAMYAE